MQPLTDFVWTGAVPEQQLDHQMTRVANLFSNLKTGIAKLERQFQAQVETKTVRHPFPYLTSYTEYGTSNSVDLLYEKRLHFDPLRNTTAIFSANDTMGRRLFIKFTSRYNVKAHLLLAEAGYAPQLLGLKKLQCGTLMVIMAYIDGSSMYQSHFSTNDLDRVRKAMEILHMENLVFGDLRVNNIFKPNDGSEVLLVDFDWCGEHGVGRYPPSLNHDSDCGWHEEVERGGIMRKAHDIHLFDQLPREP